MIGKRYWKEPGLATILYTAEIFSYNDNDLNKLQKKIENSVYREILQVPTYTPNSVWRGEVGATSSKARDIKIKILFAEHLIDKDRNELCRYFFTYEKEKE